MTWDTLACGRAPSRSEKAANANQGQTQTSFSPFDWTPQKKDLKSEYLPKRLNAYLSAKVPIMSFDEKYKKIPIGLLFLLPHLFLKMRSFLPLLSALFVALTLTASSTLSQDVSGSRIMQPLMQAKMASRERCRSEDMCGKFTSARKATSAAKCVNGFAGEYPCKGIDLLSQLSNDEMGSFQGGESGAGEGADCWGWTSSTGREVSDSKGERGLKEGLRGVGTPNHRHRAWD